MIFVVVSFVAEGICHAVVAVAFPVLILVNQTGEFWLLCHVVGVFVGVIVDTVGLHEILSKETPAAVFALPNLTLPGGHGKGAVRLMAEAKKGHSSFGELHGLEGISLWFALFCRIGKKQGAEDEGCQGEKKFHLRLR